MIIDNGARRSLVVAGVFDGMAGVSRGRVAFAAAAGWRVPAAVRATLDGSLALLTDIRVEGAGYSARYEVLK